MTRKLLVWTGGLIALFVVVNNASRSGQVISAGAAGGSKLVRTLQGR